jgi:hypothetical protein
MLPVWTRDESRKTSCTGNWRAEKDQQVDLNCGSRTCASETRGPRTSTPTPGKPKPQSELSGDKQSRRVYPNLKSPVARNSKTRDRKGKRQTRLLSPPPCSYAQRARRTVMHGSDWLATNDAVPDLSFRL